MTEMELTFAEPRVTALCVRIDGRREAAQRQPPHEPLQQRHHPGNVPHIGEQFEAQLTVGAAGQPFGQH